MTTTTKSEAGIIQEVGEFTFTNGRCNFVLDIWWTPARSVGWEIAGTELPHVPVRLEIELAVKPINHKVVKGVQTIRVASVAYPEGMEVVGRAAAAAALRDLVSSEVQRRVPLETTKCTADVFMPSDELARWVRHQLASEDRDRGGDCIGKNYQEA